MTFFRLRRLPVVVVYTAGAIGSALLMKAQQPAPAQPAPTQQPQQPPKPAQPPPPAARPNPFETVPVAPAQEPTKPPPMPNPAVQTPKNVSPNAAPPEDVIESIEFRGARRVPQDTLRAQIFTRKGDPYNEDKLRRDFVTLWNTGRFDDLRLEREPGTTGWILRYIVVERPVVRSINYIGEKSISVSDILDRFKEKKVGLVVEQQYDPNKIQRAKNIILDLLAEHGRQYAKVTDEIRRVPPSSLELTFRIDEGPQVKVGEIKFVNTHVFSDKELIRAMANLHPIGIPRSIFFESLFPKTYDSSKLEEDKSRVQNFYQEHGYFVARTTDSTVTMRKVGGETAGRHIPFIHSNKPGTRADIAITVDEGRQYRLSKITFSGVKFFRTPEALMGPLFGMREGDVFSTAKLRKGLENMRKLYGEFGFIDFVAEPDFSPETATGKLEMSLSVEEGKQFFVRRIDFSGNTTTRDKVIRRELLIDEGDMYNTRLWELSVLRLNQLGYFDRLKPEEAADIKKNTNTNTVDLTVKVHERGRNSIQLNGGVSGIAGSFIGASYSTNNFLGLGETLSLSSQLGTRLRSVQFGFTEPYLFDQRIQAGFTLFTQRFDYNQAREASILSGQNLIPYYNSLGQQNLLNYISNGYGGTVFASYPLRRSFARFSLTYGYDISNIQTLTDSAATYFQYIDFEGVGGPNTLQGIRTSKVTPAFTYNTVNHPITPTGGKSFFASIGVAGLGGNVNTIEPTFDAKYFHPGLKKGHVVGAHILARFLMGYGGKVAPPFARYYTGGENDIRGFQIWQISPIAFLPSSSQINVLNSDGTPRQQRVIIGGVPTYQNVTITIPVYQLVFPGGDTNIVTNFEYRIPIFGPLTLAIFFDAGVDRLTLPNQLKLNPGRVVQLNQQFPSAGFTGNAVIAPGTQNVRASSGLEFQVLMPVVNAPFRLYWAYNPLHFEGNLQPPIVADRSLFPNQATFNSALASFGSAIAYAEAASSFRFSVGRTF